MNIIQRQVDLIHNSSLVRNAGWMLLGQGLSVVCQALYFLLLARLLGSAEYGIYVGAFAMVSILSVYTPLGSPFVLLRYVSQDPRLFCVYWGNVLTTIAVLGSIFISLLTWGVPRLAHSYSWRLVFCAALADCVGGQLVEAAARVFQAFEKMRITSGLGLLTNFLRALCAGAMLWRFHHATAAQWVVAALAVSMTAASASLMLVSWHYGRPAFSFDLLCRRIGEGGVFAVSSSTMGIYNNIDRAMLGYYGMHVANGVYAMAYRVVDICTMPVTSIHAAAFPRFFRKGVGGIQSTTAYALQILKRTAPLALLLALVMAVTAPMIPCLIGKSFNESVSALRWLCLLPLFRSFHLSAGDALTGSGRLKLRLVLMVGAAAFNFSVNLYLIPHFGWLGAAWASLLTDGLLAMLTWIVLCGIASMVRPPERQQA
jgi:O-antigen/teichoic acid export membrane protein